VKCGSTRGRKSPPDSTNVTKTTTKYMEKALAIVVVLIVCVLLGPLGVLLVILFGILGAMFWKSVKRQLFDPSPQYRAQRRILLVLGGIALILGFIGYAGQALHVPGFCVGKDQASAIGYECGLNQGKYMAENHRVWEDDGPTARLTVSPMLKRQMGNRN
jgi:hypothetical protein